MGSSWNGYVKEHSSYQHSLTLKNGLILDTLDVIYSQTDLEGIQTEVLNITSKYTKEEPVYPRFVHIFLCKIQEVFRTIIFFSRLNA